MIKIKKIKPFSTDARGTIHGFTARQSKYFVIVTRKKGTVSGKHYHKGASKSKSPEIFYLIKGKARIILKDSASDKTEEHTIDENCLFEIPSRIYHEVHALTDIILLEFNISKKDFDLYEEDTIREPFS